MEGVSGSSVTVFYLTWYLSGRSGLMSSLGTILNAGFQAVWGQTYKLALLKAANLGRPALWQASGFLYCAFQNCVRPDQMLNLS